VTIMRPCGIAGPHLNTPSFVRCRGLPFYRCPGRGVDWPIVALPRRLLEGALHLLWWVSMLPVLPVQMALLAYPVVLSTEWARRELDFRPRYTTRATLESALIRG